ncbi:hypothetical protein V8F20_007911 [Naviculisporaceae sp. PSN 640]
MMATSQTLTFKRSGTEQSKHLPNDGVSRRFAKRLINKYYTSGYVHEFQTSRERELLLPSTEQRPEMSTRNRQEIERLECEFFDTSKYKGNTNHLTNLTCASDSYWVNLTVFEVEAKRPSGGPHSSRRKGRPKQRAASVRPVAALEDVPKEY